MFSRDASGRLFVLSCLAVCWLLDVVEAGALISAACFLLLQVLNNFYSLCLMLPNLRHLLEHPWGFKRPQPKEQVVAVLVMMMVAVMVAILMVALWLKLASSLPVAFKHYCMHLSAVGVSPHNL